MASTFPYNLNPNVWLKNINFLLNILIIHLEVLRIYYFRQNSIPNISKLKIISHKVLNNFIFNAVKRHILNWGKKKYLFNFIYFSFGENVRKHFVANILVYNWNQNVISIKKINFQLTTLRISLKVFNLRILH